MDTVGSAVFASHCSNCSEPVSEPHTLCHSCWNQITFIIEKACKTCGRPLYHQYQSHIYCSNFCATRKWLIKEVRAATIYSDLGARLIHQFKYQDKTQNLKILTKLLLQAKIYIQNDIDLIVPVPMHPDKLKMRGYNQSALLAKSFAKAIGKEWHGSILTKHLNTDKQIALSRQMRAYNIQNSFSVQNEYKNDIRNKNILIVDDVITTGSTIHECAKALIKAKVKNISIISVART